MNLLSLYHFFAGKASDKQKEAIKRWAESSPDNKVDVNVHPTKTEVKFSDEKKIFDAGILLVDKKELFQKENAPLLYKLINYTVKIAAVVLLVVVSVTIYKYQELVKKSEVLQTILVPAGQRINIILPDSTFVCLNSNTKFSYPSVFATNNRKVKLDGEAYFEVSANKNKPFYVHTSKGEIKVLGTHFNLEAYSNADVFKTSLFEGKVRVRVKGNNIYLKPDQMVCYHKNGKIHLETIHDYDQFRWREGLICIKSAKLKDIMKTFTKYFGDSIVIQNKEVEHYKYTGKFRQSRGVINALRLLQKDAPFTIEQDEDKQIIYIK